MARSRGVYLHILFFLVLLGAGCRAQSSNTLTPEVARRIQAEIRARYQVPQYITISVSDVKPSNVGGYDSIQVTFTGGSKPASLEFLLSNDRKTLARLEKMDISQDLMARINVKGRPVRGKADAKVTVVNFDDFQCPFCARMHATLFPALLDQYRDRVRFIYRDYPLVEIHPWAMHAAVDANCLADQSTDAYWAFADQIHATQQEFRGKNLAEALVILDNAAKEQGAKYKLDATKLNACLSKQDESAVRASMAEGDKLGVDATPTLFINGEKVDGAKSVEDLRAVLDRALADAGQAPPATTTKK